MHCLDCGYDLQALSEHRCPECGRGFEPAIRRTWGNKSSFKLRKAARWLGWYLIAHLTAAFVWGFVEIIRGEDVFLAVVFPVCLAFPVLCGATILWITILSTHNGAFRKLPIAAVAVGWVLVLSLLLRWPLHLAFWISQSSLEQLAQQTQAGSPPSQPVRAGLFYIKKAETRGNCCVLWMTPQSGGPDGFVYQAADEREIQMNFNVWSVERLAPDWHIVNED